MTAAQARARAGRAALAHAVFSGQGWERHLPPSAACVVTALVVHGPLGRDRLGAVLDEPPAPAAGWSGPAWDAPAPVDDGVAGRQGALLRARVERGAAALGVGPVDRMGDVLALLLACGLLIEVRGPSRPAYDLAPAPRLPAEVLAVTAGEAGQEDRLRWEALHEGVAQAVLRLFDPLGERHDRLRSTVTDLAQVLGVPAEAVRAGLGVLLVTGGVSASRDVERVPEEAPLDLVMDWERFDAERVVVRIGLQGVWRQGSVKTPRPRRSGRGKTGRGDTEAC